MTIFIVEIQYRAYFILLVEVRFAFSSDHDKLNKYNTYCPRCWPLNQLCQMDNIDVIHFFVLVIVNLVMIFSFFQSFYSSFLFMLFHVRRIVICSVPPAPWLTHYFILNFISYPNVNILQVILGFTRNIWAYLIKLFYIIV